MATFNLNIKQRTKKLIKRLSHWKSFQFDPKNKIVVLIYHRVFPSDSFNPYNSVITTDKFKRDIEGIIRRYAVISLSEAVRQCQEGPSLEKTQVVLTFDDGHWDSADIVFPILKEKGLPATFFLATEYMNTDEVFWEWKLYLLMKAGIHSAIAHEFDFPKKKLESRQSYHRRLFIWLKSVERDRRAEILQKLIDRYRLTVDRHRFITWDEVRKLKAGGMEIGSHSMTHESLANMPLSDAQVEMEKSKETIEREINGECPYFAFPFGSVHDYNESLVTFAKSIGFKACLLNTHGYNHLDPTLFCFKRVIMDEHTSPEFLLG